MKTEKMSFKNIQDVLSREEMNEIMAGSNGGDYCGHCFDSGVPVLCGKDQYGVCRCPNAYSFCRPS